MKRLYRCLLLPVLCWLSPQLLNAQTADFNATPSSDCAMAAGCTSFTVTIGGIVYVFTLTSSDAGGSMQWLAAGGGVGGSGSMDIQSGTNPNTATTEKVTISRQDNQSFQFGSIYIQNNLAETVTLQGYLNNAAAGSSQTAAKGESGVKNFNGLPVDKVELTSTDFFYVTFDDFTVSACTAPTPSFTANTVCSGIATTFTDASTNVSPSATYAWDFENDGTTDDNTKGNVTHTYPGPGTYTAKLTIVQGGCSNSMQQEVTVNDISATPVITSTVCAASTTISGTSADEDGTMITVYKNSMTQIGTGTVSNHSWTATISGINAGDAITAKSLAAGKCESLASNSVQVAASYTYYQDQDSDGFGDPNSSITTCASTPPPGFVTDNSDCDDTKVLYRDQDGDSFGSTTKVACGGVENNTDCNDEDNTIYPGAPEIADGKDNNCNGEVDEIITGTWYRDWDKDGFGDPNKSVQSPTQPEGYVNNNLDCNDYRVTYEDKDGDGRGSTVKLPCGWIYANNDCNDDDPKVHSPQTFYHDKDGDWYGDAGDKIIICSSVAPPGYVKNSIDCNDNDPKVYWPKTYYRDADGDGWGDPNNKVNVCSSTPPAGYVSNSKDTDDTPVNPPVVQPSNTLATGNVLDNGVVASFSLTATPNPFGSQTLIRYTVPVKANVTLKVYDLLGREVDVVFSGEREAGTYTATYQKPYHVQGVYICRMVVVAKGQVYSLSQRLVKTE